MVGFPGYFLASLLVEPSHSVLHTHGLTLHTDSTILTFLAASLQKPALMKQR